jgi:SAM-dependent methyltransferase
VTAPGDWVHMRPSAAAGVVSGAEYVRQITALESDRLARSAFQGLVLKLVPPGSALFDFGSGTGLDARVFAEQGHSVAAYDADPNMCEFFVEHCRDLIEAGRVSLVRGAYRDFLSCTRLGGRCVDLVTANFAPLNLIEDLRELFGKFNALTGPHGRVLASVLSPYFIGDWKYAWWWRNTLRLWRAGHYSVRGAQGPIVRRRIDNLALQSQPYFTLKRAFRGLPPRNERDAEGLDASENSLSTALHLSTCQFMFLLFEKPGAGAGAKVASGS